MTPPRSVLISPEGVRIYVTALHGSRQIRRASAVLVGGGPERLGNAVQAALAWEGEPEALDAERIGIRVEGGAREFRAYVGKTQHQLAITSPVRAAEEIGEWVSGLLGTEASLCR